MTKSLESTRAHLQGQLRSKEAENNRLTVQIKVCFGHNLSDILLQKWEVQVMIPAVILGCVPPIGSEPGASSQPTESRGGASDRAAGEAEAAGQRRQRGSETSHTSPETAS